MFNDSARRTIVVTGIVDRPQSIDAAREMERCDLRRIPQFHVARDIRSFAGSDGSEGPVCRARGEKQAEKSAGRDGAAESAFSVLRFPFPAGHERSNQQAGILQEGGSESGFRGETSPAGFNRWTRDD